MSDLHREIAQFIQSMRDPTKSAVRTTTQPPPSHRKQNHDKRGGRKK